jgi:hypothetical protein
MPFTIVLNTQEATIFFVRLASGPVIYKIDLLCQITILPTKMSDFHRQSEFETIVEI